MNFRIYLPERYSFTPKDGHTMKLRLECFNSVNGQSRLQIMLGWLRLVCSNGLVIGESITTMNNMHNQSLDLKVIPNMIHRGMGVTQSEINRLNRWQESPCKIEDIVKWVNETLSTKWNKKAATRVFNICKSGNDVELSDPFEKALPTEKKVKKAFRVKGANLPISNLYDVSQALSWVATEYNNAEKKTKMQQEIPWLISKLKKQIEGNENSK